MRESLFLSRHQKLKLIWKYFAEIKFVYQLVVFESNSDQDRLLNAVQWWFSRKVGFRTRCGSLGFATCISFEPWIHFDLLCGSHYLGCNNYLSLPYQINYSITLQHGLEPQGREKRQKDRNLGKKNPRIFFWKLAACLYLLHK